MNYIEIPKEYQVSHVIPIAKIDGSLQDMGVTKIEWCGSIKPAIAHVSPSLTPDIRYEEIQLLHCDLNNRNQIFEIGNTICKKIKYPLVIEYQADEATVIGACDFYAGKKDYENNVLKKPRFSHWLHRDILSPQAELMVTEINKAIRKTTDMKDIYQSIVSSIIDYKLSGTSRAHVDRIITDMIGKGRGKPKPDEIRKYCVPFEFHAIKSEQPKYKTHEREKQFTLVHDYEEIWYCLMKCPETKRVIEGRKYSGIDDLFYRIDSKLSEYEEMQKRWIIEW